MTFHDFPFYDLTQLNFVVAVKVVEVRVSLTVYLFGDLYNVDAWSFQNLNFIFWFDLMLYVGFGLSARK